MCRERGHRRWSRRAPNREQMLQALEERQKDLEQEIADIHDLIKRLRDEGVTPATEPSI
jgi:predicted  nucleic acid-binding Zn-ribbon protein